MSLALQAAAAHRPAPFAPSSIHRRAQSTSVVLIVLLHLLLLALLAQRRELAPDRQRTPGLPQQAPLLLQLLWPRAPQPVDTARARAAPATAATAATTTLAATRPREPAPATSAQPEPGATEPTPAATATPQAITLPAPTAAAAASAPLNLSLPRSPEAGWRQRLAALDDPRANTGAAQTLETRLTALLGGSDDIVTSELSDGSIMVRRGAACVIARPNRAQQLDPFNKSVSPKPRGIDHC